MKKIKILKNCRSEKDFYKFEYLLFNEKEKVKSRIEKTPREIKELSDTFDWVSISPATALADKLFDYKEISLGEFLDLSF
mgnify:CR=1 FL=1